MNIFCLERPTFWIINVGLIDVKWEKICAGIAFLYVFPGNYNFLFKPIEKNIVICYNNKCMLIYFFGGFNHDWRQAFMENGKNRYENGLIGLAEHYGNFFDDETTDLGAEVWNYMFDAETYEMLMVQTKKPTGIPDDLGDWHGRKCYEYLGDRNTPCEKCHIKEVSGDNFHVHIRKIAGNKTLFIESIRMDYNGRPAVLEKVIDITDLDYRDAVMNEYLCIKNLSNMVLNALMEESYITENFENVCRLICDFFDADRALITEYYSGKLNTTYSKIPQPFKQVCTELSDEAIEGITKATEGLNYIWVPDVENADKLDKNLREYWSSRGIKSIFLIPMSFEGSFVGTVSLHNIRRHFNAIDALKLLGMAVAKCIHAHIMEEKADRLLYTDPLTKAYNFSGFKRRAYELLREYPENQYYFSSMDIRYFGGINRRYGFELGDKILVETARTLEKCLDKDETFCRVSADVFCFLAKYPGKEAVYRRFTNFAEEMQRFQELTAEGNLIEYQSGAYVPEGDRDIAQAVDKANLARLSLKDEPGSSIAFFSNELMERNKFETELMQDFKPALAHGELVVYYQPQCNYSSNRIVGAEALVRWKSRKHGNVSPADFIPLLERHGLIYDLDRFVWEEVCRYQRKWMLMGCECPISVNVSRNDMLRNNICEDLCALLDKYSIPKRLFPLEITETAYIKNSDELIKVVDKLKAAGFTVEMDDFGSGYSSLNALKDVPVDLLKLDMKFLDMGTVSGKGGSILNCIVRMTRWLDLAVLAEGVETKEQAEYLKNIGCDLMQGYYFAKPMPADEFEKLLMESGSENKNARKENDINPDKFMESLISNPMLFNNMGAAAIVENSEGVTEALMVNDSFLEMMDISRDEYRPYMKDMKSYAENIVENIDSINSYVDSAKGTRTRECYLKHRDGTKRKVKICCRALLEVEGRSILLVCVDDISDLSMVTVGA